ncbi:fatty acid desaturase [Neosynechococcus sphagnicola sy1]|uniref:Fatty acid desaturase n=1 Tax=Neosynechococcus sphagnicola sy1 TaxID=1497020 RepID=A0A098TSB6_9CYAN|nr:fatty acid desaturase [Neosynechococcus sphagnicola]KGF73648.1 fatty acid desaturase [Neosynechococcus sphagnicola sy1]
MTASTVTTKPQQLPSTDSELRLPDILRTLPRQCFQKDWRQAWTAVLLNSLCVGLGYWGIVSAPWFLLPFCWIFTGTALTGFFVLAHDCGHRSFAKRRWLNDLVGHTLLLPLLYPFHSWRILHNIHHKHTNKLEVDNAWQAFQPEFYSSLGRWGRWGYQGMRGRLWWMASILHWAFLHFNWQRFEGKDRDRVRFSALLVLAFAGIALPLLWVTTGWWGLFSLWLMPWMVYHFWMSTFTLVHHTAPNIQFKPAAEWNEVEAQLFGTVHCDYPRWVEFLCHDINVHIPHHISTAIPFYNLRMAHQSLLEQWGSQLQTCRFSWALMTQITNQCHLYHPNQCYQSFQEFHAD